MTSAARRQLFVLLLPTVLALIAYANTLDAGFVYDDTSQIERNPWVKELRYLPEALSQPVWAFRDDEPTNYYRPVQIALYNLAWATSGGKPWTFHLLNVLLHALNAGLLAGLVRRISRSEGLALAVASLFAVHPLASEAVAWVACLPDLSYSACVLGALHLHAGAWEAAPAGRRARLVGAAVLFGLGLFCKETAVSFLGVVVALELLLRQARARRLLGVVAVYLLPLVAYVVIRIAALGDIAPLVRSGRTPLDALINAPSLLLAYAGKVLAPVGLSVHHVFDAVRSVAQLRFWGALLAVLALAALAIRAVVRRRELAAGAALFVFPLLPVLYIPAVGLAAFSERYAYLPLAGALWILLGAAAALVARADRRLAVVLGALLALAGLVLTVLRNADWTDNETLALATIRADERARPAYLLLGNVYLDRDETTAAYDAFRRGLEVAPGDPTLEANVLGTGLELGRVELGESVPKFEILAERHPRNVAVQLGLGYAQLRAGRLDEAQAAFEAALDVLPTADVALFALGVVASGRGDHAGAVEWLERAIRVNPSSTSAWQQLGITRFRLGRVDAALFALNRALELDPGDVGAWERYGAICFNSGRLTEARQAWERALALDPSFTKVRTNLERLAEAERSRRAP